MSVGGGGESGESRHTTCHLQNSTRMVVPAVASSKLSFVSTSTDSSRLMSSRAHWTPRRVASRATDVTRIFTILALFKSGGERERECVLENLCRGRGENERASEHADRD